MQKIGNWELGLTVDTVHLIKAKSMGYPKKTLIKEMLTINKLYISSFGKIIPISA